MYLALQQIQILQVLVEEICLYSIYNMYAPGSSFAQHMQQKQYVIFPLDPLLAGCYQDYQ